MKSGSAASFREAGELPDPPEDCGHGLPADLCAKDGPCRVEWLKEDLAESDAIGDALHAALMAVLDLLDDVSAVEWKDLVGAHRKGWEPSERSREIAAVLNAAAICGELPNRWLVDERIKEEAER